ncbi:MAG: hypothetical protein AAGI30_08325 [Planctomycetota bacterium]
MGTPEHILKKLGSEYTHGYSPRPIPCVIDVEIELLVDAIAGDHELRNSLNINQEHGFSFLAYAERMASLAVREHSPSILSKGLAALGIGSRFVDVRDAVLILALMYDSTSKLGLEFSTISSDIGLNEDDALKVYVDTFPSRSARGRSIQAMGFIESEDDGGFRYISTL